MHAIPKVIVPMSFRFLSPVDMAVGGSKRREGDKMVVDGETQTGDKVTDG